ACKNPTREIHAPIVTPEATVRPLSIFHTPQSTPEPTMSTQLPLNIEFSEYEFNDDDKRLYIKTNYLDEKKYKAGSIGAKLSHDINNDTDLLDEFIRTQSVEFPATYDNYIGYSLITIPNITENSEEFISLYIDYYTFTGGAHGNIERIAYTYLKDGTSPGSFMELVNDRVTINDVESEINKQMAQIIEDMGHAFFSDTMSLESIDPLPSFYIKDGQMVIYLQAYEIAPYAYGFPEFTMPPEIFSY
ncbi:MAG: DUF3298 and DUF4163 domain-containing protein, partial [Clostridiales bacterium]|nr:DUF3298 and DUF4163 domain-containing protein [Clostridiales bacterium]